MNSQVNENNVDIVNLYYPIIIPLSTQNTKLFCTDHIPTCSNTHHK